MKNQGMKIRSRIITNPNPVIGRPVILPAMSEIKQPIDKLALSISNMQTRYQLKYGTEFRQFLDARDQVLEHQFHFQFGLKQEDLIYQAQHFMESQLFQLIKMKIREFLAEAVGNIVSAGFKFLCRKELEEKQAMQFCAKNILLNLHAAYKATMKELEQNETINRLANIEDVRQNFIIQVDDILNDVLVNLADGYPQAPASGGTPRMRQAITQVNRTDDEENDFIYTSGIKLSDYITLGKDQKGLEKMILEEEGDYTQFIMRVVNTAIEVTQSNSEDQRQRTVFQKFTQFNQNLFWITQQKPYQQLVATTDQKGKLGREEKKKNARVLCKKFDNILTNEDIKEDTETQNLKIFESLNEIWEDAPEGIQKMKASKQFALGQKIPTSVRPFNRQEITNKQFTAKHSSILRILTKWAGYLEQIFSNPEQFVKRRLYSFRDIHNKLVNLSEKKDEDQGVKKLIARLEQEYVAIKKKFNQILRASYGYIGKFLSTNSQKTMVSSVARFTETRVASSKINAVLTSLMLNYTNILIHHLIKAGQKILTRTSLSVSYASINLVVFRVSDLMRSKLQCSESSFINILKTMYLLDDSDLMKGKFKLVRIKNKLDDPANNIMINYLFMGKVQCELQLSIQQAKGKQKNYYAFSHFVYELIRGTFGSIAECAIMIAQLDPMITASKGTYYRQKDQEIKLSQQTIDKMKRRPVRMKTQAAIEGRKRREVQDIKSEVMEQTDIKEEEIIKTKFFECSQCNRLLTDEDTAKILDKYEPVMCYQCIIKKSQPLSYLREQLKQGIQSIKQKQVLNYSSFNSLSNEHYIVHINPTGQTTFHAIVYIPKEFKTFLIKLDAKLLQRLNPDDFDFSLLDYVDISKKVKRQSKNPKYPVFLGFHFETLDSIPDKILDIVSVKGEWLSKINGLLSNFKIFREEKILIKAIKFKAQIIKADIKQWNSLDKICRLLVLGEQKQQNESALKYNKYKHLELSNMSKISAKEIGLKKLPNWLRQCRNLKHLQLDSNKISSIQKGQLPPSLVHLNIWSAGIKQVDITDVTGLKIVELGQNRINSFKHGNNPNLTNLHLSVNVIQEIDLSKNDALEHLDLAHNKMKKLTLGQNPHLKILNLSLCQEKTEISSLPRSLETVMGDKDIFLKHDFKELTKITCLGLFGQVVTREQIQNLRAESLFFYYGNVPYSYQAQMIFESDNQENQGDVDEVEGQIQLEGEFDQEAELEPQNEAV